MTSKSRKLSIVSILASALFLSVAGFVRLQAAQVLEVPVADLVEARIGRHGPQEVGLRGRQVAAHQRDEADVVEGAADVLAGDADQRALVLPGPGKGKAQVLARRVQLRVQDRKSVV